MRRESVPPVRATSRKFSGQQYPLAMSLHTYTSHLRWTGNRGSGTLDYRAYGREHELGTADKVVRIPGTSDPKFRGDAARYNPEELLVHSLSACHMLWYLHLCAVNGVIVIDYHDEAEGRMEEEPGGAGQFVEVTLRPTVTVAREEMQKKARELHAAAHQHCFIARSVNFPVRCKPAVVVGT